MDILSELNQKVLPSAFDRKVEISNKIVQKQKNMIYLGRNIFHLLYHTYFSKHTVNDFTLNTLVGDILLEESDYVANIDPLPTQILINLLKQLFHQPRNFALSLIKSNISEDEFPLIAYTTFPAIFNYFTSIEITESAGFFLLDLIAAGAPDYMVKHLTCALLFSTYTFCDCLWCTFSRNYEIYANPDAKQVHTIFIDSLNTSMQLLPYPLYFILRELASANIQLASEILFTIFLPTSFHMWHMRSPFALSIGHLKAVKDYFIANREWPSDNAVCVINSFTKNRGKINPIVSFNIQCNLSNETMVFSKKDIFVICRMFKSISESIAMFHELEEIGRNFPPNCYEPFQFSYFHRQVKMSRSSSWNTEIIKYPIPIYDDESEDSILKSPKRNFDMKRDKTYDDDFYSFSEYYTDREYSVDSIAEEEQEITRVLEKAFQQYNEMKSKGYPESSMHKFFRSKEFLDFKLEKEISILKLKAKDQEDMLSLSSAYRNIEDFYGSMKRIYHLLAGSFLRELADKLNIGQRDFSIKLMEQTVNSIICGHESLTIQAFVEVLNTVSLRNIVISQNLIDAIIRTLVKGNDSLDSNFKQCRIIAGLPPMLTNRIKLRPGQFFVLLHFVIRTIKEITPQLKYLSSFRSFTPIEPIVILKFVLRMSNCERNIIYFLFFEKILFRSTFIKYVPHTVVSDFNLFFQAMWELLGIDYQLLQELILMDLPESLL